MKRTILAVLLVLAAGAAAYGRPGGLATAQAPAFSGAVPQPGQVGLLVTAREVTAADLVAALREAGCEPSTLGLLSAGTWSMYIVGAPTAVNAGFPETLQALTPFFVRCQSAPTGAATPTPTATPTATPTPAPPAGIEIQISLPVRGETGDSVGVVVSGLTPGGGFTKTLCVPTGGCASFELTADADGNFEGLTQPIEAAGTSQLTITDQTTGATAETSWTVLPPVRPSSGTYAAEIVVKSDPGGHQPFVGMPGAIDLELSVEGDAIVVAGPQPWVEVGGTLATDGSFNATGRGTVAGFSNVAVTSQGTIAVDGELNGELTMGAEGGLPGGSGITYSLEAVDSATILGYSVLREQGGKLLDDLGAMGINVEGLERALTNTSLLRTGVTVTLSELDTAVTLRPGSLLGAQGIPVLRTYDGQLTPVGTNTVIVINDGAMDDLLTGNWFDANGLTENGGTVVHELIHAMIYWEDIGEFNAFFGPDDEELVGLLEDLITDKTKAVRSPDPITRDRAADRVDRLIDLIKQVEGGPEMLERLGFTQPAP